MAGLKAYLTTRLNMLAIQKSKMFGRLAAVLL